MESEDFERAVTAAARSQAERLRGMGFGAAAAEVDAVLDADTAATARNHANEVPSHA